MENWEEQNFNSEWREALQGAEATPSEQVWKNIDTRLMLGENATMKKRIVFYQRLAAASVGILFLVSGYAFFNNSNADSIAENNDPVKPATEKSTNNSNDTQPNAGTEIKQTNSSDIEVNETTSGDSFQSVLSNNNPVEREEWSDQFDVAMNSSTEIQESKSINNESLNIAKVAQPSNEQMHFQFSPVKINSELPKKVQPNDLGIAYRIADAKPAIHKKKKKATPIENSWAARGLAAGTFSQKASNLDLMQASLDHPGSAYGLQGSPSSGKSEKSKPGSSFSMSLFGGKRLTKRWLIQGGLNYLNQNAQSKTSAIEVASANSLKSGGFTSAFAPENANSVTYTTNSQINSTFQFISLPVQAGYMLVDQKLGVQLNGGISPDMFLKSVVSDRASGDETVSTAGSNTTFKTLSFSGLGGVEVSYRIAEHYRISLVPGFRYALTPVYKENSLASSKPFTADIGLRFRYVFN